MVIIITHLVLFQKIILYGIMMEYRLEVVRKS
jgi:hypothetical protein